MRRERAARTPSGPRRAPDRRSPPRRRPRRGVRRGSGRAPVCGIAPPQDHLPGARRRLARRDHLVSHLLHIAADVGHGGTVIEDDEQLAAAREPPERVLRPGPGQGTEEAAQIQALPVHPSWATSSWYCAAGSSSETSCGEESSISIIQPFSYGSSLIPSGASTRSLFTLVTFPVSGAKSSLTALVLSTTPNGSPRTICAPTSGSSR